MPNMPKTIEFKKQDLANLKLSYSVAIKNNKTVFKFKGHKILVSYAKYVIEYLDGIFNKSNQ